MYQKKTSRWLMHIDFIALDMLFIELAYLFAFYLRGYVMHETNDIWIKDGTYVIGLIFIPFIDFFVSIITSKFDDILRRDAKKEFKYTVYKVTYDTCVYIVFIFLIRVTKYYSRSIFILTWVIGIIFIFTERIIWKKIVKKFKLFIVSAGRPRMLVITDKNDLKEVKKGVLSKNHGAYDIIGMVLVDDDSKLGKEINGLKIVATKDDVLDYLCREWVDEVFISLKEKNDRKFEKKLVYGCTVMGVTMHENIGIMMNEIGKRQVVDMIGECVTVSSALRVATVSEVIIKRCTDIIGGLVGVLFTIILCIFIGPIIYIQSPGPIFFKQTRIGKNGRRFKMYKFRSMYMDAEERKKELMAKNKVSDGLMFKIENDPRIIGGENGKGIGNFIRKHSLDEFPQFINVLKGDMSIIGTRPPTEDEWEKYDLEHRKRMSIKPGITGMWQVSGRSNITEFDKVVALDVEYIANWSVWLDLKILCKTVLNVFRDDGSY